MKGIDITYLGGNIVIVLNDKDKFIEKDTGNLLVELIYEALGDIDIVECNEINGNMHHGGLWVDGMRSVFFFTSGNVSDLKENGRTFLQKEGDLTDYVNTCKQEHLDFLRWYYNVDEVDIDSAIYRMYDNCGWNQTDASCNQYRKDLTENTFLFREDRVINPETKEIEIYESTIDLSDYSQERMFKSVETFGYSFNEMCTWIDNGTNLDLIAECIFELEY